MAILQAKATGQTDVAEALEREVSIREEAKRIAESTGLDPKKAMQIAQDKAALQDRAKRQGESPEKEKDSRYGADGRRLTDGRKKIMGFSRTKAGLPAFGGAGLLGGFRGAVAGGAKIQVPGRAPGIVPPGVAKERQTRKQQEAAAAKMAEPRWDLVEAIDQKLAGLGLV